MTLDGLLALVASMTIVTFLLVIVQYALIFLDHPYARRFTHATLVCIGLTWVAVIVAWSIRAFPR